MARQKRSVAPASVKDVASLAGVSVGTVSNVLNVPERVSPVLVERVNSAIEHLGYVRNEAARQLRVGQSETIGFIVPNFHDTFIAELARGVDDAAASHGLAVLTGSSGSDAGQESALLTLFDKYRLAGIILFPLPAVPPVSQSLPSDRIPLVLVEADGHHLGITSVLVDNIAAGSLAAEHILARAATRVVLVSGTLAQHPQLESREKGARSVFAPHRDIAVEIIHLDELSVEAGRLLGEKLLARAPEHRPDAVLATHDLWALGILTSAMATDTVRVPEDLIVVGCEDIDTYGISPVPLTTIKLPAYEVGRQAVESLVTNSENHPGAQSHLKLQPKLLLRDSSQTPKVHAGSRPVVR